VDFSDTDIFDSSDPFLLRPNMLDKKMARNDRHFVTSEALNKFLFANLLMYT